MVIPLHTTNSIAEISEDMSNLSTISHCTCWYFTQLLNFCAHVQRSVDVEMQICGLRLGQHLSDFAELFFSAVNSPQYYQINHTKTTPSPTTYFLIRVWLLKVMSLSSTAFGLKSHYAGLSTEQNGGSIDSPLASTFLELVASCSLLLPLSIPLSPSHGSGVGSRNDSIIGCQRLVSLTPPISRGMNLVLILPSLCKDSSSAFYTCLDQH